MGIYYLADKGTYVHSSFVYKIWIIRAAEKDVSCNLSTYSFSINYYSAILPNTSPWKIAVTSFTEGLIKGWAVGTAECASSLIDEQKIYCFIVSLFLGSGHLLIQFQMCDSWKCKNSKVSFSQKCQEDLNSPHNCAQLFPRRFENDTFEKAILRIVRIKIARANGQVLYHP